MPIVVSYPATIARVQQVARAGEVVFVTTRWLKGRMAVSCEQTTLNAYAVRDEFLSVTTEREALNFVREQVNFYPLAMKSHGLFSSFGNGSQSSYMSALHSPRHIKQPCLRSSLPLQRNLTMRSA